MVVSLPSRIMNYKVSAASTTEELVTLGQILSEVGDYAGSILDRDHLSLTRKCSSRLKKVVDELMARKRIQSQEDLYAMSEVGFDGVDLTVKSIDELYKLYRRWPLRHKEREAEGRESRTYYFEHRIIKELLQRKPLNKEEQFKIDYCVATYSNELENLSYTFSLPVKAADDKIYPDYRKRYTADELTAMIALYSDYRDIEEREILIEYVDYAIDLLGHEDDSDSSLRLAAELAELGRRQIICIPSSLSSERVS